MDILNLKEGENEMKNKIRIGIAGYGNLGRGVESAIPQNEDMKLSWCIYEKKSRRPQAFE